MRKLSPPLAVMALMPPACVYSWWFGHDAAQGGWVSCTSLPCTAMLVSWPLNRLMVAGVTNAVTGVSERVRKGLANFFYGGRPGATIGFLGLFPVVDAACVFALGLRAHGIGIALHRLLGIEAMQGLGALLLCALTQGNAQLLGGFELSHSLKRASICGFAMLAPMPGWRLLYEQQVLGLRARWPAVGVAVKPSPARRRCWAWPAPPLPLWAMMGFG